MTMHTSRTRRPAARWTSSVLAVTLTATSLGLAATAAQAATDVSVALPLTRVDTEVWVASGPGLVAADPSDTTIRVSNDAGQTWADLNAPQFTNPVYVADGTVVYADEELADGTGSYSNVYVYDFATNSTAAPKRVNKLGISTANTTIAISARDPEDPSLEIYDATVLATGVTTPLAFAPHATSQGYSQAAIGSGPNAAISTMDRSGTQAALTGYIDVVPLDGSATVASWTVPGLVAAEVRGQQVIYVTGTTSAAKMCARDLVSASTVSCVTLASGDYSKLTGTLRLGDDWATMSLWNSSTDAYLGTRLVGGAATLSAPVSLVGVSLAGWGDSPRPLAKVKTSTASYIGQVSTTGAVSKYSDLMTGPAAPDTVIQTPATITGLDDRPAPEVGQLQPWVRSVSDSAIGTETLLAPRASELAASAARTILRGSAGMTLLERGVTAKSLPSATRLGYMSGPYYTVLNSVGDYVVRKVDGTALPIARPEALFGSLALYEVDASFGQYELLDLAQPGFPVTEVTLPAPYDNWDSWVIALSGDWLLVDIDPGDTSNDPQTLVYNIRTHEQHLQPGYALDIGDGFALIESLGDANGDAFVQVWDFVHQTVDTITDDAWIISTDNVRRIAYSTPTHLVSRTLDGVGASAPRVLGTVISGSLNLSATSARWKPEIDTTKAMAAGTIEIRDSLGTLVRTLAYPAADDGSIRPVWDGTADDTTTKVALGTYTWTLAATAADGTGALQTVAGQPTTLGGTLTVTNKSLGTVTGTTPKVSDTTPVTDQVLTAIEGAWGPNPPGVTFSYKWFKGTTEIAGETGKTYTVRPTDVGSTLKVQVKGIADGYTTLTKNSAATYAVAKAGLTPKPTPVIDDTTPTVDTTVTTNPGLWGPDPVTLAYQWYKVSSGGTVSKLTSASATTAAYQVQGTDAGYKLKVKVTGSKPGYTTASKTSALTAYVAKAVFTNTPEPTIAMDGMPRVGKLLTAVPGTYVPAATTFTYQWYRGTSAIYLATKSTYTLTSADLGKAISLRVKASRTGYVTVTKTVAGGTVAAGLVSVTPKLSDTTPVIGQTLSITDATSIAAWGPQPVTATYQWYRGSTAIAGADQATYTVVGADAGYTLKVKVIGAKDDYASVSKTSAASYTVPKGTFTTKGVVAIIQAGPALSVDRGTWVPVPDSASFQWYRNGTAITGATADTYTATSSGTYTVKMTAKKLGYTSAAVTSAGVAVVI